MMRITYNALKINSLIVISILLLFSCVDESPLDNTGNLANPAEFNLFLTDCPFEAEAVNVEIVTISLESKDGLIEELTTNAGIYNLLEFTDGVDTLLASGSISISDIKHINFELGEENSIVVDGETFPLELRNGNVVKIKVNLNQIDDDDYLIDFMACTSIIRNNNGYFLKPVIKFKGNRNNAQGDDVDDLIEDIGACYDLVFPISLLSEDGENLSASDEEQLIDLLNEYEIESIIYPFSVVDSVGLLIEINSEEEAEAFEDCDEDEENEEDEEDEEDDEDELEDLIEDISDCYQFIFPITLIDSIGNTLTVNNEEELEDQVEENEFIDFEYPLNLNNEAGESFVIQGYEDFEALNECDDNDDGNDDDNEISELVEDLNECYIFDFPVVLNDFDNNTFTANDSMELEMILEQNEIENFEYPVIVIDESGDPFTAHNINQFNLLDDCDSENDSDNDDWDDIFENIVECFSVNYPVNFIDEDGDIHVANNQEELEDLFDENEIEEVVFPISLNDGTGNVVNISEFEDILSLDLDC